MREIFRYKSKNILYSTGTYEEDEEDIQKRKEAEAAMQTTTPPTHAQDTAMNGLTPEEMAIVNASKSDNRISDSVADIVAHNL